MGNPTVSVVMLTYGHENFIEEAINSILMQECKFEVELIIANDCSPDNTDNIIKKILKLHKNSFWIKYIKHKKNIGMMPNFIFGLQQSKGKYIALCEGDDFWTDPSKIQKQVTYLENNLDCSMVFHLANCINLKNKIINIHGPKLNQVKAKFDIKDAIIHASTLVPTNSMLFHSQYIKDVPTWFYQAPVGDVPLILLLAHYGNLGFLNQKMSAYRVMTPLSWSKQHQSNKKIRIKHFYRIQEMWRNFNEWSNYSYKKLLDRNEKKIKIEFMQNEFQIKYPSIYIVIKNLKLVTLKLKNKFNG